MNNWRETTLGKVANVFTGYPFKSGLYSTGDQDVRLLRGDNISQGAMDWSDARKWPAEQLNDFEEYQLKEDDIVLAMDRPWIGAGLKFSQIIKSDLPALLVQRTARLRGSNDLDIGYLKYVIGSPWFTSYIKRITTGSLVPHISLKQIRDFPVKLPPIEEQKAAAAVLLAIDKKIELNNRINAELEAMAKTLYDYWFVQFDFPDANGKPYKTSGGKMVYNPTLKREIPEGWSNEVLGKIINMERGVTYGKEDVLDKDNDNAIGVLRATNVTGNSVDINDLVYVPKSIVNQTQKIESFETIIVMSSGSKEHVGKNGIYYFDEPLGFGAFCSKIVPKKGARSFVNTFLQTTWFRAYIKNQCLGTNINNLTGDHINKCPIALPAKGLLERFEEVTGDIYQRISVNAIENQKLTALRDWLLPMLMNGQVTVK